MELKNTNSSFNWTKDVIDQLFLNQSELEKEDKEYSERLFNLFKIINNPKYTPCQIWFNILLTENEKQALLIEFKEYLFKMNPQLKYEPLNNPDISIAFIYFIYRNNNNTL